MSKWSVYLAGPDVFFDPDIGESKKTLMREAGFDPLFPLDNELDGEDLAARIFSANLEMINNADVVLANITPFRSVSCDPGTAFELGYALHAKKRIYTYSSDPRHLKDRLSQPHPAWSNDGFGIEDFALIDNLMIACAAAPTTHEDLSDPAALIAFELAIQKMKIDYEAN